MCYFTAELVEHRTGIAEVTGSNPVETLIFFRLLPPSCLNWKLYSDDHCSLSSTTAVQYKFHIYFTKFRRVNSFEDQGKSVIRNTNSSGAPQIMYFRLDSVLPTYCLRSMIKLITIVIILIINVCNAHKMKATYFM